MIKAVYDSGNAELLRTLILLGSILLEAVLVAYYAHKAKHSVIKCLVVLTLGNCVALFAMAVFAAMRMNISLFSAEFIKKLPNLPLTMIHGFVYFPLLAIPLSRALKISSDFVHDSVAVSSILYQGIGHIGCVCVGCCHGYASLFGIYNPHFDTKLFPIQLVDCLTCVAIFVCFAIYFKKKDYKTRGILYPAMLSIYGFARFVIEFGRDNEKVFIGLSEDALHALFMLLVGAISLYVIADRNRRRDKRAEERAKRHRKQAR